MSVVEFQKSWLTQRDEQQAPQRRRIGKVDWLPKSDLPCGADEGLNPSLTDDRDPSENEGNRDLPSGCATRERPGSKHDLQNPR